MLIVVERVDGVSDKKGSGSPSNVAEGQLIVFLRQLLILAQDVLVRHLDLVANDRGR